MGSMIFGLILLSLGAAGIISGVQPKNDSAPLFLSLGVPMEIAGFLLFLSGIKQYYIQEIIIELKKMNGEKMPKSTEK